MIIMNEFAGLIDHYSLYCMAMAPGRDRFVLIGGCPEIIGGP